MPTTIKNGDFVMTSDGEIGLSISDKEDKFGKINVQFGTSGPVWRYRADDCRLATRQEIEEAGLQSVGHNEPAE